MVRTGSFFPSIIGYFERPAPWVEWVNGTVLFADVSGFTPLSESLAGLGAEGAEILTDILNRYFHVMIGTVHSHGGQVMKFGGDAILCFFPGDESHEWALSAAIEMQHQMKKFRSMKTPLRRFSLSMKTGVAWGETILGAVGDPSVRCDYFIAGEPVDKASEAEHRASSGDIVLAISETDSIGEGVTTALIEPGYHLITSIGESVRSPVSQAVYAYDEQVMRPYLIPEIHRLVTAGEARMIGSLQGAVPVFMQFSGFEFRRRHLALEAFDRFFRCVHALVRRYGGHLNRISMGDKGNTFFILFGAPSTLEKKEHCACAWALSLRTALREQFPGVRFRIGLNTGRVFSGLVGGADRFDFTVMGDTVNFAARLMQGCEDGSIAVSRSIQQACAADFQFAFQGDRRFKGKSAPLPVFHLLAEQHLPAEQHVSKSEERVSLIGRRDTLDEIAAISDTVHEGSPVFIVLTGEPGIGKSALVHHIARTLQTRAWDCHFAKGELTRRHQPLFPWKILFRRLFFPSRSPTLEDLGRLIEPTCHGSIDFLPHIAEFFEVSDTGPVDALDAETRNRLLFHHLVSLVIETCRDRPTLLVIDDLQWFDSQSLEMLKTLIGEVRDVPLMIIACTRQVLDWHEFKTLSLYRHIPLAGLTEDETRALCERLLDGNVDEELVNLVQRQTSGNPLYSDHVIQYLRKQEGIFPVVGTWTLNREHRMSGTMTHDDVIIGRFEGLSTQQKHHVRYALCAGVSGETSLIRRAMGASFRKNLWLSLAETGLLRCENDGLFSFTQNLVQDTLYQALPRKIRVRIHRRIGRAYESLYGDQRDRFLVNLANHFHYGGHRTKTVEYASLAGFQLLRRMSFHEAVWYLEMTWKLSRRSRGRDKWEIGLALVEAMIGTGSLLESLPLIEHLERAIRRSGNLGLYGRVLTLGIKVRLIRGDYSFLRGITTKLSLLSQDYTHLMYEIMYYVADASFRRGHHTFAEQQLRKLASLWEDRRDMNPVTMVASCGIWAAIFKNRRDWQAALNTIERGLALAREKALPYHEIRLMTEKANIFLESGDFVTAINLYHTILPTCRDIGDLYMWSTVLTNLGKVLIDTRAFTEAEKYITSAIDIAGRSGSCITRGIAFNYAGIIAFEKGNYQRAAADYEQSRHILEQAAVTWQLMDVYYNLAEVHLVMNDHTTAKRWIDLGIALSRQSECRGNIDAFIGLENRMAKKEPQR